MSKPKILLYDIETRYILFRGWRPGKQYVDPKQIVVGEDSDIICIAYKWLGSPEIYSLDWGLKKQDSAKMIDAFSKVIESADLCIGHNADKFDARHINTQRWLHKQPPIAWPTTEDTLKQIRKYFYLPSYKLDYIAKLLTGSGKKQMEFQVWIDIVEKKDPDAFARMIRYCEHDVRKLEQVFNSIAPYCKPKMHAGLVLGRGRGTCPRCGSERTVGDGYVTLLSGQYLKIKCNACGAKSRSPKKRVT